MIKLDRITKYYRTQAGKHFVFRDLSLEIPTGIGVAVLGRNGAGKSTLLNIIGGAERPDGGQILSDSTVSWPVGLSGSFQSSLTGRDNVKFVARLYGGKSEMRRVVDFVRDFAEIGEYFDMPVRTYSSGMRSRVAFGLSVAFGFDYYLIDEVTSVGDPQFHYKCNAALEAKRAQGAGFIVVSHQMEIVRRFCTSAVVLSGGGAQHYLDVEEAIGVYQANG